MALTNEELVRELNGQTWTSHNIRLGPELTTLPGRPDFETDLRLRAIVRFLTATYRGKLAGLRVADLGSLEGGFSLALAQRNMDVTGIEARRKNLEKAQLIKKHFGLPRLEFVLDDVKNFSREKYGMFDVVLALGILYHLDAPASWLDQISKATKNVLVIESHYAPQDDEGVGRLDERLRNLGPLKQEEHHGEIYEGRWYFEYGSEHDRENQLWASYSNRSSFWLTKESLLRATRNAGFDLVFEQHDYSIDSYKFHTETFSRGLFCALRSESFRRD